MKTRHALIALERALGISSTLALLLTLSACATPRAIHPAAKAQLTPELAKVATYRFGDSREPLTALADQVRAVTGKPAESRALELQLTALLNDDKATSQSRQFVCRQLAFIGTAQSVPALAEELDDQDLTDMARYALESIPDPAAVKALQSRLGRAKGREKIGLINSLGVRRDEAAVPALARQLKAKDPMTAQAAARALGKIGGAKAAQALATTKVNPAAQNAAKEARIACATDMARKGQKTEATAILTSMMEAGLSNPLTFDALEGMQVADPARGQMMVIEALKAKDPKFQAAATRFVREIPGPEATQAFAAELPKLNPEGQALLLAALADRGDAAARPQAAALLKSDNADVRLAAIKAMGRLGDASTVAPLTQLAATGQDAERPAAEDSLARQATTDTDKAILASLADPDAKVRAVLIRALAARHTPEAVPALLAATQDGDKHVQAEAYKALGTVAGEKDLPQLLKLVMAAPTDGERERAEKATIDTCARIENPEAREKPVLAVFTPQQPAAVRCALMRVMGGLGGVEPQKAVSAGLTDKDPAVRETAVRVLSDWPDASAIKPLRPLAQSDPDEKSRILALRGYVRLIGQPSQRPANETIMLYQDAMTLARRAEDKKMVLAGLGNAGDPQVLEVIEPYLADKELQDEAQAAMLGFAKTAAETYPDLARQTASQLVKATQDENMRKQAGEVLAQVKDYEDFMTSWQVAGPFKAEGKTSTQLHDTAFEPETNPQAAQWTLLKNASSREKTWCIDLNRAMGGGENCVVYLRSSVWVPKAQPAVAHVGSDDGNKIWLNGELVNNVNAARPIKPGEDQVKVQLREGWNTVLVKVTQGNGDWGLSMRFRQPDAAMIDGLKVRLEEPAAPAPATQAAASAKATPAKAKAAKKNGHPAKKVKVEAEK